MFQEGVLIIVSENSSLGIKPPCSPQGEPWAEGGVGYSSDECEETTLRAPLTVGESCPRGRKLRAPLT